MNVVMVSLDQGLLDQHNKMSDSRARHIRYADALADAEGGSHLHILVRGGKTAVSTPLSPNLTLHATQPAIHHFWRNSVRFTKQIHQTMPIDLITTQSPFVDGRLGVHLAQKVNAPLLVQLHLSSLGTPQWLRANKLNPLRYWLAKSVIRQADGLRVVNQSVQSWLVQRLGVSAERVFLLPVTAVLLTPNPTITKANQPTILYVGRLSKEKGVDTLLTAFQQVVAQQPDACLQIIGDGPERQALEHQAKQTGVAQSTTFEGAVAPSNLADYYQRATVFALPSRHESFGRVIIEAFSLGLPVVATQTEGATALIDDNENGLLTPIEDPQRLAKALLSILNDTDLAQRLGQAGKETAVKHTDITQQTKDLIACWQTVAKAL